MTLTMTWSMVFPRYVFIHKVGKEVCLETQTCSPLPHLMPRALQTSSFSDGGETGML